MVGREVVGGLVKGSRLGQVTIVETVYGIMVIVLIDDRYQLKKLTSKGN